MTLAGEIGAISNSDVVARRLSRVEFAFYVFGLLFVSGALNRALGGFRELGANLALVESPLVQLVGAAVYAVSIIFLIGRRGAFPRDGVFWTFAALLAFAMLSSMWSPQPAVTMRRAFALWGTTAFALSLASLTWDNLKRVVTVFAVVFVGSNALMALAFRDLAFHHSGALFYGEHAGRLRGLYNHKNDFARVLGLVIVCLSIINVGVGWRKIRFLSLSAGILMLVAAGSAKTFIAIPLALGLVAASYLAALGARRVVLLFGFVAILVVVTPLAGVISSVALEALGRDPTLSSRTIIWEGVIRAGREHAWLGGGYSVGWWVSAAQAVSRLVWQDTGNAHNGYLQLWIELGFIGLFLFGSAVAQLLIKMSSTVFDGRDRRNMFATGVVSYILVASAAGSYLMLHNDIFWVALILAALLIMRAGPRAEASGGNRR